MSSASVLFSQVDLSTKDFLDVYIDCETCNMNDIRLGAGYVNYVLDPQNADLHVLVSRVSAGTGRYQYSMRFIGRKDFSGMEFVQNYNVLPDMTAVERRDLLTKNLTMGLVPYWMQTGMSESMAITVKEAAVAKTDARNRTPDNWNNWIFSLEGGSSMDFESIRQTSRLWGRATADRVTEQWRVRNLLYARGDYQVFTKNGEEIRSVVNRNFFSTSTVRSLNDNWSAGVFLSANRNTFSNYDLSTRLAPVVEYSLFPYTEVQQRSVTAAYRISYLYRDYAEETIYGVLNENLFGQSVVLTARYTQPWGTLFIEMEGSHLFHDWNQNRLVLEGRLNIRVVKGLSLNIGNSVELINDQRSLPRREISLEELLLAQRQAATSFRLGGQMGVSYTFGSIYNNIVNTRINRG